MNYLLTLDLATRTGWTYGEPGDARFAYGTHRLPSTGEDIGSFLDAYRQWFITSAVRGMPAGSGLVVFEAPILPQVTSLPTVRKLYGLCGLTELLCMDHKLECMEIRASQCRGLLGVRKGHGESMKEAVMRTVQFWGYQPEDDNAADAIALRLYTIHLRYPEFADLFNLRLGALGAA